MMGIHPWHIQEFLEVYRQVREGSAPAKASKIMHRGHMGIVTRG